MRVNRTKQCFYASFPKMNPASCRHHRLVMYAASAAGYEASPASESLENRFADYCLNRPDSAAASTVAWNHPKRMIPQRSQTRTQ